MTPEELVAAGIRIEVDASDRVAIVTLDRPPVNALDPGLMLAVREAFRGLSERRDINAIVLTGAGRIFCAGADIKQRHQTRGQVAEPLLDRGKVWREAKAAVLQCAVPVIGAINGVTIGGGVGLASSCDILIASEAARFGVTEINVGVLGGGSVLLRMIGPYKMRKLYYTGELIAADEMYRLGAVEAVVPADKLMDAALDLAREIAAKSPIAIRLAKEALIRMELSLNDWIGAYRMEQDYSNRLIGFEDSREAMAAFSEKRPPVWKWR